MPPPTMEPGEALLQVGIEPIHPGIFLAERVLAQFGASIDEAAEGMGLPSRVIEDIVKARSGITAELANALAAYTKLSPGFWLSLQAACNLAAERSRLGQAIVYQHQPLLAAQNESSTVRSPSPDACPTQSASGIDPSHRERALRRGQEIANGDVTESGGTFTLAEVIRLLSVGQATVERLLRERALFAVPGPRHEQRFPAFQFRAGGPLPHLPEVLAALPTADPWAQLNFLVNRHPDLDNRRPFEVMLAGDHLTVFRLAREMGEMGH